MIAVAVIAPLVVVVVLACTGRRLWATELVQSRVLRWTGHSYYVPTSWSHCNPTARYGGHSRPSAASSATTAAEWGTLAGGTAGTRRTPARASTVRLDVPPSPTAPSVETDTAALPRIGRQGGPKLTTAAQCSGPRAAAVDQPAGTS